MKNSVIKKINVSTNLITDVIVASELYRELETVFDGQVLQHSEWVKLFEGKYDIVLFDQTSIQKIINFYHEIKELINSKAFQYMQSFSINQDDLYIVHAFYQQSSDNL